MAQCSTIPFSVGGTVETDTQTNIQADSISSLEITELNKKSLGSGDNQIACADDLPVEEVIVYGRATIVSFGFVRFFWSPTFAGGGGGGGGSSSISIGQVNANEACNALGGTERLSLLNIAFVAARTLNSRNIGGFLRDNPPGSTFEVPLPNGSVIRGIVSGALLNPAILAEASNSCG